MPSTNKKTSFLGFDRGSDTHTASRLDVHAAAGGVPGMVERRQREALLL
jgi:hypothetical protein